ncbi:MAG: hypothetical protein Q9202_002937 [Teloschistes flavicans]
MACLACTRSPLYEWHSLLRALPTISPLPTHRTLTTQSHQPSKPLIPPRRLPPNIDSKLFTPPRQLKTYPPPPGPRPLPSPHTHPLTYLNALHVSQTLDPTGSRTRLFAKDNPDSPRVGDILLVTFTSGDPFSGVCLNIRRRGPDTGILLRNKLLMVGTEMWVKVFSPKVRSIEVVERARKRARRARLTYMRKPKYDRGSVEGVVEEYLKKRRLVRSGAVGIRDPSKSTKNPASAKAGVRAR